MGYLPKNLILESYKVLSNLTEDHKQGQTQIVSAIRHLVALDMYYNEYGKECDLSSSANRDAFVRYVRRVVKVEDDYYTTNFYTNIKQLADCGVGSNFFSAGVVNNSKQNTTYLYDYPTRGQYPVFKVKNNVLIWEKSYLSNINNYLCNDKLKSAFLIWLLRNSELSNLDAQSIKQTLSEVLTPELLDVLFPNSEQLQLTIDSFSLTDKRAECNYSEITKMFQGSSIEKTTSKYRPYITAIKSKPFLLLAGISGTGKSRIVRELARACWDVDSDEYRAQKPRNFEMVQVKPNWHDSSELIGYVSRIDGERFVVGPFLKFIAKAWEEPDVPYFLCLDEMNLAPVEQYFAEYLSVVESRKMNDDGVVVTDPIIEYEPTEAYFSLLSQLGYTDEEFKNGNKRLTIPQNLIVVGTVNMDETTFSFSRKVLDRAMTIEMNEVDLEGGLTKRHEQIGKLGKAELVGSAVEGVDVYAGNKAVCDRVIAYLKVVNSKLEGTPFKIAYRTRNEFLLYVVNNLPYNKDEEGNDLDQSFIIARALDEITNMKILSRIEGDETKVSEQFLKELSDAIKEQLEIVCGEYDTEKSISLAKLKEMKGKLSSGYTSFWS